MSDKLEWPFSVLGLEDENPDKKAVRRAYAKALKAIDQAADPQGFQALRQAYEAALDMVDVPHAHEVADVDTPLSRDPERMSEEPYLDSVAHPVTEAPVQMGLSPEAIDLVNRVSVFTAPEPDVDRLLSILNDPAMSDPVAAQAVEEEIYHFLYNMIDDDGAEFPGFALRGASGFARNPPESHRTAQLFDQLDGTFGWMSDQVRMQNRFYGYDRFCLAATYLGSRRMSPPPEPSSGINRQIMWPIAFVVILFLANVVPDVVGGTKPRLSPPAQTQFEQDKGFLFDLHGVTPSPETLQFLHDLAQEHEFPEVEKPLVDTLVTRNWALRTVKGDNSWMTYDIYSDMDAKKYMTGVMLAAKLQLSQKLSYRDASAFSLSWDAAKKSGVWRNIGDGYHGQRIWGAGGGYMIATSHDPDDTNLRVVYPQEYADAVLNYLGSDFRSLEGAFGLKPYTLDQRPQVRLYYFDSVTFERANEQPVDIDRHFLSRTGLGDNRWPIRAATLPQESCQVLTITSGKIERDGQCAQD